MEANDDLTGLLASVAGNLERRDGAAAFVRDLIIGYAEELRSLISALPQKQVAAIGLTARVVVRGPTGWRVPDLIGMLPAMDDTGFEVRPNAASLYLECFGGGLDRAYFELRSNPGTLFSAIANVNDANFRDDRDVATHRQWLEDVCGIQETESGLPFLVYRSRANGELKVGLQPKAFLTKFLRMADAVASRRAAFNQTL